MSNLFDSHRVVILLSSYLKNVRVKGQLQKKKKKIRAQPRDTSAEKIPADMGSLRQGLKLK